MKFFLFLVLSTSALADEAVSYTWWNGDDESQVWVDSRRIAKLELPKVIVKGISQSPRVTLVPVSSRAARASLRKGMLPKSLSRNQLVFTNARNGGVAMVLVGNVIVRLKDGVDGRAWSESHHLAIVEKISYEPNTYIIATAAGLPALKLANALRIEANVKSAEPLWWMEMTRK